MLSPVLAGGGAWKDKTQNLGNWINFIKTFKVQPIYMMVAHQRNGNFAVGISLYIYMYATAAAAKSLQSCPTLCDPIDGSPPGSPLPGILQARTLERVAISFSSAWKWKVKVKSLSHVWLLATPWTAAYQAPSPMGFSRQEYWSGVPLPSPIYMYIYTYICIYTHTYTHTHMPHFLDSVTVLSPKLAIT